MLDKNEGLRFDLLEEWFFLINDFEVILRNEFLLLILEILNCWFFYLEWYDFEDIVIILFILFMYFIEDEKCNKFFLGCEVELKLRDDDNVLVKGDFWYFWVWRIFGGWIKMVFDLVCCIFLMRLKKKYVYLE